MKGIVWPLLLISYLGSGAGPSSAASVEEIVRRAGVALNSDWAADPKYACIEKDETQKGDKTTSKTFEVVMLEGSDYHFPLAVDDQPLSPERENAELVKFRNEVRRRKEESPSARANRIAVWKKQRDENGELLLDFPSALTFQLLREETKAGHSAYVFAATPKSGVVATTRAAKVLSGMQGTAWVEKDTFHPMRVECTVMTPVPVFGALASVLPGTQIEIGMIPVTDSTWLIDEVTTKLNVSKLHMFKSTAITRSTYTHYRLNSVALEELLAKAVSK